MPPRIRLTRTLLLLGLALAAACAQPTPGDLERLASVRAKYGTRYEFSSRDIYLRVRARPGVAVDSAEAERIYTTFFMSGARGQSALVYLNLYDHRGRFLYQLYYDPELRRIVRGRADAY